MPERRHLILYGSLALTLFATYWVSRDDELDVVTATVGQVGNNTANLTNDSSAQPADRRAQATEFKRAEYARSTKNLFATRNTFNVTTASGMEAPPPIPATTPLPFVYLGQQRMSNGTSVFLLYGDRTLTVRKGDVIENLYSVVKITPQSVEFVYLPSKEKQYLDLGSAIQ